MRSVARLLISLSLWTDWPSGPVGHWSLTHGHCDARSTVTFPAAEHHRPLTGNELYCLVTEAHVCEQLVKGCYPKAQGRESNPRHFELQVKRPKHHAMTNNNNTTFILFYFTCGKIPKTPSSLASFKSRLVLPFWYRLTQAVLEKSL